MAENFSLERALALLAEDDWLRPTEHYNNDNKNLESQKTHEEDPRYWIAQASLLLMNNYQISARAAGRILSIDRDRILRSTKKYPEVNPAFTTADDLVKALHAYKKRVTRNEKF